MPSLAQRAQSIADLYQPPHVGRPSDIGSQSTVQQFLEAVGEGNYIETAAKLAGLSKQSVYEWIKRGEAGESPYALFADAVKEAEARAEAKMLANVRRASELPQFWAAGMTVLERRHPDRWGKRNDDQTAPRVVVQIGVGQGEVKVGLAVSPSTFAPDSQLEDGANSLTGKACALSSSPITALMLTNDASVPTAAGECDREIPAVSSGGGSTPTAPSARSQGSPALDKGRSAAGQRKRATGTRGSVSRVAASASRGLTGRGRSRRGPSVSGGSAGTPPPASES